MPKKLTINALNATTPHNTIASFLAMSKDMVVDELTPQYSKVLNTDTIKIENLGEFSLAVDIEQNVRAIEKLVELQPRSTDVVANLFNPDPNEEVSDWQSAALLSSFSAITTLALAGRELSEDSLSDIARLSLSLSPAGHSFREVHLNTNTNFRQPAWPIPDNPGIPQSVKDLMVKADTIFKRTCAQKTVQAMREWANAVASGTPRLLPNTIRSMSPANCCPGEKLEIFGTGFGNGDRSAVVFTTEGSVVVVNSRDCLLWSDTKIELIVPDEARRGPVAIVVFPEPLGSSTSLAIEVLGLIEQCFGPQAVEALGRGLMATTEIPPIPQPRLEAGNANLFLGGPPVIEYFSAVQGTTLHPKQSVTLEWRIFGADRIEIVAETVSGSAVHELPPINGRLSPASGSVTVQIIGSRRWHGTYVLKAFNRCTGTTKPTERRLTFEMALRQGLALGGGGTRGDFQLGALLYLYNEKGFRPEAIASTSVGSVNALELMMGDDSKNAAERLKESWLALRNESDMWAEEPWLSQLKPNIRKLVRSISIEGLIALPYSLTRLGITAANIDNVLKSGGGTALFNLDPIETRIRSRFDPQKAAASGIRARLVAVSVNSGEIIHITETGQVIARANNTLPLPPGTLPAPAPDVVDGAIASAAMPGIFRSRRVGNHNGVDGGVRDVVPVKTAVKDLGCNRVYAIRCSAPPLEIPLQMNLSFSTVMARSVFDLTYHEVAENDVDPFNGWGAGVEVIRIEPSMNLHDPLVVEPGLIRIAIDYGWLRAADTIELEPGFKREAAMRLCDEIITLRVRNWELAYILNNNWIPRNPHRDVSFFLTDGAIPRQRRELRRVPTPEEVNEVRANARQIRNKLIQRANLGARNPVSAITANWFQAWEECDDGRGLGTHTPSPWHEFVSPRGTALAETPPPPL